MTRAHESLASGFWLHVTPVAEGCWLWRGARSHYGTGYGRLKVQGRTLPAHRVSWEIHFGPTPDGLLVLHHCDVKNCVRPDHLYLGTQSDNMRDVFDRGQKHSVKLSPAIVRELRSQPRPDTAGIKALAVRYGVGRHAIGNVYNGARWRHVA